MRAQGLYWASINYTAPPAPGTDSSSDSKAVNKVIFAVTVPVGTALLLAVAGTVAYFVWMERRRRARGLHLGPGPGPLTTLLLTDIQDSTVLWDALPPQVMDAALHLHHSCIRMLLHKTAGGALGAEGGRVPPNLDD